jgi:GT2 family glycosyltransferase
MKITSNKIVSVIIVTCQVKNYLELCLDSLNKQSYSNLEIIVIDNSSDINLKQEILNKYPKIKLYSVSRNLFYAEGLNLGINKSNGEFILCLNDDVILKEDFIQRALEGFYLNKKIGMVSGKILRSDKKTIDSTGLFLSYCRTAKERGYGSQDKKQFEKAGYIFGVNGAVAFYRKVMLEEIKESNGYFDPRFRMFYEDLDIAWRANRLGWKGYYIPLAVAYHVRGGSARLTYGIDKPYARRFLRDDLHIDLIKNRYLVIIKNESFFSFLLHLVGIILYDFIVWGYLLFFKPHLIKYFILHLKYLRPPLKKDFYNFPTINK